LLTSTRSNIASIHAYATPRRPQSVFYRRAAQAKGKRPDFASWATGRGPAPSRGSVSGLSHGYPGRRSQGAKRVGTPHTFDLTETMPAGSTTYQVSLVRESRDLCRRASGCLAEWLFLPLCRVFLTPARRIRHKWRIRMRAGLVRPVSGPWACPVRLRSEPALSLPNGASSAGFVARRRIL
jgi:hypothetical protein